MGEQLGLVQLMADLQFCKALPKSNEITALASESHLSGKNYVTNYVPETR